jgi:sorbitol-specific phosphotransferase system component IIBC
MNTYIAFYNSKSISINADSLYSAKCQAVKEFKASKKNQHMVSVVLDKVGSRKIVHSPDF